MSSARQLRVVTTLYAFGYAATIGGGVLALVTRSWWALIPYACGFVTIIVASCSDRRRRLALKVADR
jgi:hypothetical protein